MNIWEVAILKIIAANEGTASLQNVYDELPKHVKLTNNHYKVTYKVPAYHHQIRAHVDDLLDRGELYRAERGVYSITLKGQSRIGAK